VPRSRQHSSKIDRLFVYGLYFVDKSNDHLSEACKVFLCVPVALAMQGSATMRRLVVRLAHYLRRLPARHRRATLHAGCRHRQSNTALLRDVYIPAPPSRRLLRGRG
jgi:hypothetical protein